MISSKIGISKYLIFCSPIPAFEEKGFSMIVAHIHSIVKEKDGITSSSCLNKIKYIKKRYGKSHSDVSMYCQYDGLFLQMIYYE